MFSKQEASQLRKEFWTTFGQYMKPVPSFDEEKINWLNYRTGVKNVLFKMEAGDNRAMISIEIVHPDLDIQQLYYEQFLQLKPLFQRHTDNSWTWAPHMKDENGSMVSRIYSELTGASILKKSAWPALISFFKSNILALDEFWSNAKYRFESL